MYGTGYCDAQCPHDIKFINGQANMENWQPSKTDRNAGTGKYGSCCTEFDMWEGNSISTAYTAHSCNVTEQFRCEGVACGDNADIPGGAGHRFDGVCDKNGCDLQTFRMGQKSFYGPGSEFAIDSTKPVRVTTQFITDDNTDDGHIVEIRRFQTRCCCGGDSSCVSWRPKLQLDLTRLLRVSSRSFQGWDKFSRKRWLWCFGCCL